MIGHAQKYAVAVGRSLGRIALVIDGYEMARNDNNMIHTKRRSSVF